MYGVLCIVDSVEKAMRRVCFFNFLFCFCFFLILVFCLFVCSRVLLLFWSFGVLYVFYTYFNSRIVLFCSFLRAEMTFGGRVGGGSNVHSLAFFPFGSIL